MPIELNSDRLLTRPEVQTHFGLSQRFLETSVTNGAGPPIIRIGRSVRYRMGDLRDWIEERRTKASKVKE